MDKWIEITDAESGKRVCIPLSQIAFIREKPKRFIEKGDRMFEVERGASVVLDEKYNPNPEGLFSGADLAFCTEEDYETVRGRVEHAIRYGGVITEDFETEDTNA